MAVTALSGGIPSPIRPLWDEMPLTRRSRSSGGGRSFAQVFDDTLASAAGYANPLTETFNTVADIVREADTERVYMEYLTATGQLENPALLSIAESKAQLATNLMVQLRNRVLESYNELMRISM